MLIGLRSQIAETAEDLERLRAMLTDIESGAVSLSIENGKPLPKLLEVEPPAPPESFLKTKKGRPPRTMDSAEVAKLLGITAKTATNLAANKKLIPIGKRGFRNVFERRAVLEYAKTRKPRQQKKKMSPATLAILRKNAEYARSVKAARKAAGLE
jgi:hypothetical protein